MFWQKCFFSLVVSEDVLKKMPVDGRKECVQLVLFQEGGSILPVKDCTVSSCLQVHWEVVTVPRFYHSGTSMVCNTVGALVVLVTNLFHFLLQSLLLLYNISEGHKLVWRIPVVHDWHQIWGVRLAALGRPTIGSSPGSLWLFSISWTCIDHRWLGPVFGA